MLTDRQLRNLKPPANGGRKVVWDASARGNGALGVRVSVRAKTFVYRYHLRGKTRWLTLGRYPALTLAEARTKAAEAAAKLEKGLDPAAGHESPAQIRKAETVEDLVEQYLRRWARPRKRSWREDERILRRHVVSRWGELPAKELRRRDVIRMLEEIAQGAPTMANRTLAVLRKAYNWAIQVELVETNPCWQVPAMKKERPRDRVLSAKEIRLVWAALGRQKGDGLEPGLPHLWPGRPVRLALRLALVTAQRVGEITGAAWKEFDLDAGWWTIPAERAKNGLAHRVPLTDMAAGILQEIRAAAGDGAWLLPSRRNRRGCPIHSQALSRAVHQVRQVSGVENWRAHDLRRTAASGMASAGVPRLVISRVLNHVETGVTAVYDRHGYDAEKREALEAWEARLREILSRS